MAQPTLVADVWLFFTSKTNYLGLQLPDDSSSGTSLPFSPFAESGNMTAAGREDVGRLLFIERHQNSSRLIPSCFRRTGFNPGVKFFFALPLIRKVGGQSGRESGGRFKGLSTGLKQKFIISCCTAFVVVDLPQETFLKDDFWFSRQLQTCSGLIVPLSRFIC